MHTRRFVLSLGCAAAALAAAAQGAAIDPVLLRQLDGQLGIGYYQGVKPLTDRAALPLLYHLLEEAETGGFRQHSGALRGKLIQQISGVEGHAEYLADEIDRSSGTPDPALRADGNEAARESAFDSLAAVATPQAEQVLRAFLSDDRVPAAVASSSGERAPRPNSFYAARALAQVHGLAPTDGATFTAVDVPQVRQWVQREGATAAGPAQPVIEGDRQPASLEAPSPETLWPLPSEARVVHLAAPEPVADREPAASERITPPVAWYSLAAFSCFSAAALPLAWRRARRSPFTPRAA